MELNDAAVNLPRGGLCSIELVINGPTPTPTFLPTTEGRGTVSATPVTLAASVHVTVVGCCADLPPTSMFLTMSVPPPASTGTAPRPHLPALV